MNRLVHLPLSLFLHKKGTTWLGLSQGRLLNRIPNNNNNNNSNSNIVISKQSFWNFSAWKRVLVAHGASRARQAAVSMRPWVLGISLSLSVSVYLTLLPYKCKIFHFLDMLIGCSYKEKNLLGISVIRIPVFLHMCHKHFLNTHLYPVHCAIIGWILNAYF